MSVLNANVNMYIMLQVLRREIIKSGEHNIQQPVNLKRLLWNAQRVFDKEQGGKAQSSRATRDVALVCIKNCLVQFSACCGQQSIRCGGPTFCFWLKASLVSIDLATI